MHNSGGGSDEQNSAKPLPASWKKLPPDVRFPEELIAFEESAEKPLRGFWSKLLPDERFPEKLTKDFDEHDRS